MDLTPHLTPQNKLLGIIVHAAFQIFAHSCHFGPKNQAQSLAPLKNDKIFRSIFCHFVTLAASLDLHMHNFCQNFTWSCFLSIPAGNRSRPDLGILKPCIPSRCSTYRVYICRPSVHPSIRSRALLKTRYARVI